MTLSHSLLTTIYTTLIFDTVRENATLLLMNTTHIENKTEEILNTEFVNNSISHMMTWPNYLWFAAGLGTGIFIMLIVNSKLYCQVWCSNFHILRRIRISLRIFWHRFIVWFRHFCLCRLGDEYFFPTSEQNIGKQNEINIYSIPRISHLSRFSNQQQSQLPQMSQPRVSRLLQLTNQSQSPSQQSQWDIMLPAVSRKSRMSQQSLSSSINPVSERLLVSTIRANPATISPTAALIRTTVIPTMIATSTTTTTPSTSSSMISSEDYVFTI